MIRIFYPLPVYALVFFIRTNKDVISFDKSFHHSTQERSGKRIGTQRKEEVEKNLAAFSGVKFTSYLHILFISETSILRT
jgi:hypothetical protein